ncbi:MAG: hypothetical protein IJW43_01940 [Clostridia bacterium]|nr:hypothetical protein [Clostridia bacterium]
MIKRKFLKRLVVILLSIILGLGVILGGAIAYFRLPVSAYYKASEKAFIIPDIKNGYVPQGIHFDEDKEFFILSGYWNDHSPSPIYLLDKKGITLKKVFLTISGEKYDGHGGGVAVANGYLYLAGGENGCIYVFSYEDLLSVESGNSIESVGKIDLYQSKNDYLGVSFITVKGDRLITGEFYREGNYPTLESHKITTKSGDYNQAIALEYKLNVESPFGVEQKPIKAYSMPNQVQGLAINDGKIYLSTSWGVSFSRLYEYDEENLEYQGEINILGKTLPLYSMDSSSLVKEYKLPPMSEEIVFINDKLYVSCESASSKYLFGRLTGGKWIYKTDLTKIK